MSKQNETKYELYLEVNESRSGGGVCEGETGRWANHEDEIVEIEVNGLTTNIGTGYNNTIDVDFNPEDYIGKKLYCVIVRYGTGDTFGHTNGAWHIEGCYTTPEEAATIEDTINNDTYKAKNTYGYLPWCGHFEKLLRVEVYQRILNEKHRPNWK